VAGRWFYLYLIMDLYSRKILGREVHAEDNADHASHLVRRTVLAEGIATRLDHGCAHIFASCRIPSARALGRMAATGVLLQCRAYGPHYDNYYHFRRKYENHAEFVASLCAYNAQLDCKQLYHVVCSGDE
jgi:transposase InsO family protein